LITFKRCRYQTQEPKIDTLRQACERLVSGCAALKEEDDTLVVSNPETRRLGELIFEAAQKITSKVHHMTVPPFTMHGQEPPGDVADAMLKSDVIFAVTRYSMAHSKARWRASEAGARYLSLPDYSESILMSRAMQANFRGLTALSQKLAEVLSNGNEIRLTASKGTNLRCMITGRIGNPAPGWCWGPGTIASPPDAETNIAVLEEESDGEIFVDGSIPCPEIGLLKQPIRLKIKHGRVIEVSGESSKELERRYDILADPRTRVVAELGIGLNPLARLSGLMLEDEGCLGTVHLGMGSNITLGGKNDVPFHLDHVIREACIEVDGKRISIDAAISS
jgi:leucyl aminopeptidase (aminopeptidase T)